jgi:hypothetical protein
MAIGDQNGLVLYLGQWISYSDYLVRSGQLKTFNDNNAPVYSTNNPNNPFETAPTPQPAYQPQPLNDNNVTVTPSGDASKPFATTEQKPEYPTRTNTNDLNILDAAVMDNGDIAFQAGLNKDEQIMGMIAYDSTLSRSNLTYRQKQQLRDYVKTHPEATPLKRTADERIAYYNKYGMAVYEGSEERDPFAAGDSLNAGGAKAQQQADADKGMDPSGLIIPFGYGGMGQVALLTPDTMVYPVTGDVATVYPQKIPLTMTEDPRSGMYALDFTGDIADNIYFDPVSKKFYDRYVDKPTPFIGLLDSRYLMGSDSGAKVVTDIIKNNEKSILGNPLNADWVKSNIAPPKVGPPSISVGVDELMSTPTESSQSQTKIDNAPGMDYSNPANIFKGLGAVGLIALDVAERKIGELGNNPMFQAVTNNLDLSAGRRPGFTRSAVLGGLDAIAMTGTAAPIIVGAVGYEGAGLLTNPGPTTEALKAGLVVGVPSIADTFYKNFKSDPVRAGVGIGGTLIASKVVTPKIGVPEGFVQGNKALLADTTGAVGRNTLKMELKPVNEMPVIDLSKLGPDAIKMADAFTGMSQSGKVATRIAARDAMAERSLGFIKSNNEVTSLLGSRIAARDAMAARQIAAVKGEYQAGLLGDFSKNINRNVAKVGFNSKVADLLPFMSPGVVAKVITERNNRANTRTGYNIPMPNIGIAVPSRGVKQSAPVINISGLFNFTPPKQDAPPKVKQDDYTIPAPFNWTPPKNDTPPKQDAPPKNTPPDNFMPIPPWFRPTPPGPGNRDPTPKIRSPSTMADPFKIKPSKRLGTYTYRNNPEKLLGAISGPVISMPKVSSSRKGKKNRGKNRGIFGLI